MPYSTTKPSQKFVRARRPRRIPAPVARPAVASPSGELESEREPVALWGQVLSLDPGQLAVVQIAPGKTVAARLPQHIDAAWLEKAAQVEPVNATVYQHTNSHTYGLAAVYPSISHREIRVPITLHGSQVEVEGQAGVTLRCGEHRLELQASGAVVVQGREIHSTASGEHCIRGAVVRLN